MIRIPSSLCGTIDCRNCASNRVWDFGGPFFLANKELELKYCAHWMFYFLWLFSKIYFVGCTEEEL